MSIRTNEWPIGEWTFYEVVEHGFPSYEGQPLYGYNPTEASTFFPRLEHAMAAAIAEKFIGPPMAGGSAVGSAADWFMRMIGADELKPAGPHQSAGVLMNALEVEQLIEPGDLVGSEAVIERLKRRGYVIAKDPAA